MVRPISEVLVAVPRRSPLTLQHLSFCPRDITFDQILTLYSFSYSIYLPIQWIHPNSKPHLMLSRPSKKCWNPPTDIRRYAAKWQNSTRRSISSWNSSPVVPMARSVPKKRLLSPRPRPLHEFALTPKQL